MFTSLNFNLLKFFCARQSEVALAYRVTVTRAVHDAVGAPQPRSGEGDEGHEERHL